MAEYRENKSPKVGAVIVTYNAMRWIERTLNCLESSSVPLYRIYIIDNGSVDSTVEYLARRASENVGLYEVHSKEMNLGFGAANNIGMKMALEDGCSHILLVNQDAYIAQDMIEHLLKADCGDALLSPVHLNGDGSALDHYFRKNALLSGPGVDFVDKMYLLWANGSNSGAGADSGLPLKFEVASVNAALWMMPRALVEACGLFNPLFFHYGEDENYLRRLKHFGFGVQVVPRARVCHDRISYGNASLALKSQIPNKLLINYLDISASKGERRRERILILGEAVVKGRLGAYLWMRLKCLLSSRYHRLRHSQLSPGAFLQNYQKLIIKF